MKFRSKYHKPRGSKVFQIIDFAKKYECWTYTKSDPIGDIKAFISKNVSRPSH